MKAKKNLANLDALVPRADFEVDSGNSSAVQALEGSPQLKMVELEADSLFFKLLRKPDFQRRTAHWTREKISGFIESFVKRELIPSIILWQSKASGNIFVIDGAHRLSALIAWVHDDYGDGKLSIPFFDGNISRVQKELAKDTRDLVARKIRSYVEIKLSKSLPEDRVAFAENIATTGVTLQWVKSDAAGAYRSFHTINTEQTPIGNLEIRLIRDRRSPNVLATRALVQAGTGEIVRTTFSAENKAAIRDLAKQVYDDLFVPEQDDGPAKTIELPVAGRSYQAESLETILNLVEFLNKRPPQPKTVEKPKGKKLDILEATMMEDVDGAATLQFLHKVKSASSLIVGNQKGSLGLHPFVYFYSATGALQPVALLASISLVQEIERKGKLLYFTKHRHDFEELLIKWKYFINFIVQRYGSGIRSLSALVSLYQYLLNGKLDNKQDSEILPNILRDERLEFLNRKIDAHGTRLEFTKERKSAIFLNRALTTSLRCEICKARIHPRSFNIDHIANKADGGTGAEDNGQLTHPFCNSSKNALEAL